MKSKKMRRGSFNSESGAILLIVIILMLALTITGLAFLNAGVMENSLVRREVHKNQAFYLAEAGLERTLWNLKQDFENDQDWTNGINGMGVDLPNSSDPDAFYSLLLADPTLGDGGEYSVELRYVFTGTEAEKDEIWVRSTGTVEEDISKTVEVYVKIGNLSPWNNAIFAGVGATGGKVIEGNARIHGSVHILGTGLGSDDLAMDMTGDAGIRNSYEVGSPHGMPPDLAARVPECPETSFNGEEIESLDATLRVKQGKVGLSGTATVGKEDVAGNSFKETTDGVYVTDGYGGNMGADNVNSDNGTGNTYDLGDSVEFPRLSNPYVDPITGTEYDTYLDYLSHPNNSLHITGINEISSNIDTFEYGVPGANYIKWDKDSGLLTINGIIYIEGGSLDLGESKETIEYSGSGTIVVASPGGEGIVGDIRVHGHLLAQGTYEGGGGFPKNVLGLITGNLSLAEGESQRMMTGAFYAEKEIVSGFQNEIAGTFVSNYFNMGEQVPRIYEVPELATKLPKGMPGGEPDWHVITSQWSEL